MKFSVIVPTYQEEGFIAGCLGAIRKQDYPKNDFEVIVSDAHSRDRTVEIARTRADKVVVTERRGIGHGRNFGAKHARGEYLVFVDADVLLDSGFLKQCSVSVERNGTVGITGVPQPVGGTPFQRLVYRATYWVVRLFHFFGFSYFPGICVAYEKKAFDEVRGFREDFGIVEDLDLSRRISFLGHCEINGKASAQVSTRRLHKHAFSTIVFHLYNHVRYLLTGTVARHYPKIEEISSWRDIWRVNKDGGE